MLINIYFKFDVSFHSEAMLMTPHIHDRNSIQVSITRWLSGARDRDGGRQRRMSKKGDGAEGDDAEGDGAEGEGAEGDRAEGDRAEGNKLKLST